MSIRSGFAFSHDDQARDNAPSAGDGGPIFNAPAAPDERMDTSGGLDSHLSRDRGSERDYREAQAASEGIHDGGSPGLALPTDIDRFSTTGGHFVHEDTVAGYGVGGTDPLVVNDTLPDDSNAQAGGRPVA